MAILYEAYSVRRSRENFPTRYTLTFGFFGTLVIGIGLFFLSTIYRLSSYDLFMFLLFLAMLFILLSGIFAISGLMAWIVDIYASRSRARSIRAHHRIKNRRQRWLRQSPQNSIEPSYQMSVENDDIQNGQLGELGEDLERLLPGWLIPLLKNRPAALAIHDDLKASSKTQAETESQIQSQIDELEPDIVVIRYPEVDKSLLSTPREKEIAKASLESDATPFSEADIEKEAILNLLGALELQQSEGRITKSFYQRKRKKLLTLLSKVTKQLSGENLSDNRPHS
jgi:hypothetical protein